MTFSTVHQFPSVDDFDGPLSDFVPAYPGERPCSFLSISPDCAAPCSDLADAWWLADGVDVGPDLDDDVPVYVGRPFRRSPVFDPDPSFRWGSDRRACGVPISTPPLGIGMCRDCARCSDLLGLGAG